MSDRGGAKVPPDEGEPRPDIDYDAPKTQAPSRRAPASWWSSWPWWPIVALTAVMIALWAANPTAVYQRPHLLLVLNLIFVYRSFYGMRIED